VGDVDLRVLLLLALPILGLALGFFLALRAISRTATAGRRSHTADGREILWSEPFARLLRDPEQPPGPGNLMVTPEALRFERYLSRRLLEIPWGSLGPEVVPEREGGRAVVLRRPGGETAFRLRDPGAFLRALEERRR
jgi:hypothetical protein